MKDLAIEIIKNFLPKILNFLKSRKKQKVKSLTIHLQNFEAIFQNLYDANKLYFQQHNTDVYMELALRTINAYEDAKLDCMALSFSYDHDLLAIHRSIIEKSNNTSFLPDKDFECLRDNIFRICDYTINTLKNKINDLHS